MKCRKVAAVPAKVDVDAQEAFKKKSLQPRLGEARAGSEASTFVMLPFRAERIPRLPVVL